MATTSGFARPRRRSTAVETALLELPEPIFEPLGVDDPKLAHGGRPRRTPGPPAPGGLVRRVRPPLVLPTRVRRIHGGMSAMVDAA
jgi:hypothetical protein